MKIAVVGTGYVGLVTGVCLAEIGNAVTCIDIDLEKVKQLSDGKIPIYEPGLDPLFQRNIQQKRIRFISSLSEGIQKANIIFLALPTPSQEDGSADVTHIERVANQLGDLLTDYTVVVTKSTVPVGTTERVKEIIQKKVSFPIDVVSNPEFLREGYAVDDFMKPDRIIIGTTSEKAKDIMSKLYMPFTRQGNPLLFMDERSAELAKYAANAFLATKITFMNEIANLCEKVGANVESIRDGIGADERIGKRFLFAGIGYGGGCFPKDVLALSKIATDYSYDFKIIRSVMEVNSAQQLRLFVKMKKFFKNKLENKTIAIWGLSFKPNTDDIREAPAIANIHLLLKEKAIIRAYDPEAMPNTIKVFNSDIYLAKDPYDALIGADALMVFTEWPVFRSPDFEKMNKNLNQKIIFDGRNVFEPLQLKGMGYEYFSIGREKES